MYGKVNVMTKAKAEKLGVRVLKELGEGWTMEVWDNLGWHVHWINGGVSLACLENTSKPFWAMVGDPKDPGTGHVVFASGDAECSADP
jgi:hypothetical protein